MKNVDVVIYGSLTRPMGPSGTLRRILRNRPYLLDRGYDLTSFSPDGCLKEVTDIPASPAVSATKSRKSIVAPLKKVCRKVVKKSYVLSSAFYRRDLKKKEATALHYLHAGRKPDILVFHALEECFFFLQHCTLPIPRIALFFHSDAIPFKMISYNYPKLKGSKHYRDYLEMERTVVSRVDKCVFISRIGMDNFIQLHPEVPRDKISLIINGIEDFSEEERVSLKQIPKPSFPKYRLISVGTINGRKGQQIICEALANMDADRRKDVQVVFIGDGSERVRLEDYCLEHGLTENARFLGTVPNRQIPRCLSESNIFILMSYNEGLPISIIEAMRAGLPVISTGVSGIPELVCTEGDGQNGVLLDPDVSQLTDILNNLDRYGWDRFGVASRRSFETHYTFDRMKREYCDMLDSLA